MIEIETDEVVFHHQHTEVDIVILRLSDIEKSSFVLLFPEKMGQFILNVMFGGRHIENYLEIFVLFKSILSAGEQFLLFDVLYLASLQHLLKRFNCILR